MFNLLIGLICTMISNILLGISLAKLKKEFSKEKVISGLIKITSIVVAICLMYYTSFLNNDLLITNINGTNVNLIDAIKLLFTAGILLYGSQSLIKLKNILRLNIDVKEKESE